jgi:hypothetical protein
MSTESSSNSHALAWALSILAVPVFYVLTLPPMMYFSVLYFGNSQMVGNFMFSYEKPYNWLMDQRPLEGPLEAYADWWGSLFGASPSPP